MTPSRLGSTAAAEYLRRLIAWLPSDARWLGQGSIPVFLAFSLLNFSNLLFHVAVSRLIGPAEYGQLAAVLSVVFVVSVPVGVVQAIAAKRFALLRTGDRWRAADLLRSMTRTLVYIGIGAAVLAAVLAPIIGAFLRMSWIPVALIGPYAAVSLLAALAFGYLQGELRFSALSVAVVVGVLVRLALGVLLASSGLKVSGAMVATVIGQATAGALAMWLSGVRRGSRPSERVNLAPFRGDFWRSFLALAVFALIAQVDLVLARHFLSAEDAGLYSAAGLIARAMLFLPAAVAIVVFPRFAQLSGVGHEARRWLRVSLVAIVLIACAAIPVLSLSRNFVVVTVLGPTFGSASGLVPVLSLAMAILAIANLLTYFHIAAETHAYRFTALGVISLAALVWLFHGSPWQIAWIVLGVSSLVALLLYKAALSASIRPQHRALAPVPGEHEPPIDVTVVLPCHNSEAALEGILAQLCGDLFDPLSAEVIVVSDGSTDRTVQIARSFAPKVRIIERAQRGGKGNALRAGLREAKGQYVAFIDSDGDIDPQDLRRFVTLMDLYQPDLVQACKRHPMSELQYPLTRRVMSWLNLHFARALFRVNVQDTMTGLKVFRREVLESVLPSMMEKRYAFDLEFLVIARLRGYKRVFEAPVHINYQFDSHVNAKQAFLVLIDTLAIFYRRYFLGTYHERRGIDLHLATPGPAMVDAAPQTPDPSDVISRLDDSPAAVSEGATPSD